MNSLAKKLLVFILAMVLVAGTGWFGRKLYKRMTEEKLVRQTHEYLEKQDWRSASLCLQRALQINPLGFTPTKMMADLMEALGSPTAVGWRIRVTELEPESAQHRFDWARTAIRAQDYKSAGDALMGVDEKSKTTAAYHKHMGAWEWGLKHPAAAEKHYLEALRLEPTNQVIAVNLATVQLTSTNAALATSARASLERMVADTEVRLTALRHLKTEAVSRKALPQALGYSAEVMRAPDATLADKIDHLQLLRAAKSEEYAPLLTSLKEEGSKSPAAAFALGRWMAVADSPTNALVWLWSLPVEVRTNHPTPLVLADCLILTKDWEGLLSLVDKADWGQTDFYRLALVSLAQRSLGQKLMAESSWRKALRQSARRLDRLTRLTQLTKASGWKEEHIQVLREITDSFPREIWAVDMLTAHLYLAGDTRGLHQLLSDLHASNPSDPTLKNNLAYVCLLLRSNVENAHRLAKEAYEFAPEDPSVISTYAYSLHLQGKREDALKVLEKLEPESLKNPTIAASFGLIQVQAGRKEVAAELLARAETNRLLPEEKEMVRLARSNL